MSTFWLRRLKKVALCDFCLTFDPYSILAPTWTQVYFFRNASNRTEIKHMKWKHNGYLFAQQTRNTLRVHIVLHKPFLPLFCCALALRKCLEIKNIKPTGPKLFMFILLEVWFVYHLPLFVQFFDVDVQNHWSVKLAQNWKIWTFYLNLLLAPTMAHEVCIGFSF